MTYGAISHTVKRLWRGLIYSAVTLALFSCSDDNLFYGDGCASPEDTIIATAKVEAQNNTRSYMESGTITDGLYYLHYPPLSSNDNYSQAYVDFNFDEGDDTGFAYFISGDSKKDLKWKHVYGQGQSVKTFWLTNADPDCYTTYSTSMWYFYRFTKKDVPNPYKSGILDTEEGSNDLLYGSANGSAKTGKIDFTLKHALSLVKVNVEVYSANDKFFVNLDNADVTITDVANTLSAFDLKYPTTISYGTNPSSSNSNTCYYCDIADRPIVVSGDEQLTWESKGPYTLPDGTIDSRRNLYTTKRFVMPFQSFPVYNKTERPKLVVRVPKADVIGDSEADIDGYVTYSASLPLVMFQLNEFGEMTPAAESLRFKPGTQINITATINSPDTELTFAPVTVETWSYTNSFTLITKQTGIYTDEDFLNMVRVYNSGNLDMLDRFGYRDADGIYNFQLWGRLELDRNTITQCMKNIIKDADGNDFKFRFVLNGYEVVLTDPSGEEKLDGGLGAQRLYNIVTGADENDYTGITTLTQWQEAVEILKSPDPDLTTIYKYGYYNNADHNFTVDIRTDLNLNLNEVVWSLPEKFNTSGINFNILDGKTVRLTLDETDRAIECRSSDSFDRLAKVMVKKSTTGFTSEDELHFLIDCYNYFYPYCKNILSPFGDNGTTCRFYFNNVTSMILDGDKIMGRMIPGNGLPNYTFSYRGTNTSIKIYSQWFSDISTSSNATLFANMLARSAKITNSGSSTWANTVSYYNKNNFANLWTYSGYFDPDSRKWIFNFSSIPSSIDYNILRDTHGFMEPDEKNMKYDYEFVWNGSLNMTNVPKRDGSGATETVSLKYPDDAETMKSICRGEYEP